ncbi:MAG: amino acid permease [Chitinophagales bacterium]|nr:amino acid permease [Chitinophagales bacterium]
MSLFRKKSLDKINDDVASLQEKDSLRRVLTVKDLTFMGIAAVVGAGIFSTIGQASFHGGPGVIFLFVITAVTCGFSALCYAEFAGRVPISGSAYTYAYVSFGEIIAWVIGWALILEYAIGNIVVAISWSGYLDNLLHGIGLHIPEWLMIDPFTASETYQKAIAAQAAGTPLNEAMQTSIQAYAQAPILFGKHVIFNLPAFIIVVLITILAYIGIKESKKSANFMVIFKIAVILFVIVLGFFYVDTKNWNPFLPNGIHGVLAGVSAVFYAYIGFDAISTTAEECKNPQRDLPKGMVYSLIICTVLYILIALVLTGMVNYTEFENVTDPLSFVFEKLNLTKTSYLVSISAVVATTSVLLVFQLGQPRIWMSMSRDGLLPKRFAKVHPKFHTPSYATIITGLLVGIPTLIMPADLVTDLTSIGTLFAFVLVCLGVLVLPRLTKEQTKGKFSLPYINGKIIIPIVVAAFIWFTRIRLQSAISSIGTESYHEILFLVFIISAIVIAVLSFLKNYSTIPIIGALCCMYLMIEIPAESWLWFFVWMFIGLCIYYFYGRKKSKLANQ